MELYEFILISVFLLAWSLSLPYLRKFRIFQFSSLLVFSFATGILITETVQTNGWHAKALPLFTLLLGGFIYQAFRFYKENFPYNA
jgi:uncharacterized integral membrane protein